MFVREEEFHELLAHEPALARGTRLLAVRARTAPQASNHRPWPSHARLEARKVCLASVRASLPTAAPLSKHVVEDVGNRASRRRLANDPIPRAGLILAPNAEENGRRERTCCAKPGEQQAIALRKRGLVDDEDERYAKASGVHAHRHRRERRVTREVVAACEELRAERHARAIVDDEQYGGVIDFFGDLPAVFDHGAGPDAARARRVPEPARARVVGVEVQTSPA